MLTVKDNRLALGMQRRVTETRYRTIYRCLTKKGTKLVIISLTETISQWKVQRGLVLSMVSIHLRAVRLDIYLARYHLQKKLLFMEREHRQSIMTQYIMKEKLLEALETTLNGLITACTLLHLQIMMRFLKVLLAQLNKYLLILV